MTPNVRYFVAAIALLQCLSFCDPHKILGVFPFENWSHTQFFFPLMKELASRGHQVTVISHIKNYTDPIENYTDISLDGLIPLCSNVTIDYVVNMGLIQSVFHDILDIGIRGCRIILESDVMKKFNQSDAEFDVVIVEIFNTDCFVPFAHRFKAPLIGISSSPPYPWYNDRMGMPNNPSYISTILWSAGSELSFWGRLINTISLVVTQLAYKLYYTLKEEEIARKFFGPNMPPLDDLVRNTSLLLLNTHPSISATRPVPPGVVEVAGLSLKPPKQLPQDLEEFISGAEHGVVYFSLGSMLNGSSFDPDKKRALIDTFSALPQRVLWRAEEETESSPSNVKVKRWFPQLDILNHPNTKLFITHGGLFSMIEAASTGTPILGMPFFADQFENVQTAEDSGFGRFIRYPDITKENLHRLITTLLSDKRYAEKAKTISKLFKDRPMSPMDTAVYWVEHVIRHKGAPHLKSQAVNLPWYKFYLVDVILFLLGLVILVIFTTKLTCKFICHYVKPKAKNKQKIS